MSRPASSFVREFDVEPERVLVLDRHYLLCLSSGLVRLEADGRVWSLPPARAALIAAQHPIRVTVVRPTVSASALFDTAFVEAPPSPLAVFDLTPLARELVRECAAWGESDAPLPPLATTLFQALAGVAWRAALTPSPTAMPVAHSAELRRALELTEANLHDEVRCRAIASEVGLTTRSLARRFEDELGMTWRAALRRLRVVRAIEHLASGDDGVARIAASVGYGSLSAFNAAFKELTGLTPSEYRASCTP